MIRCQEVPVQPTAVSFDKGSILIKGEARVPYGTWDERVRAFRAQALYYREILEYLGRSGLSFKDSVQDLVPCPVLECSLQLRGYQADALKAWDDAGKRGTILLPTGAGKTVLAISAIANLNEPTIVIVPTLDLLEQWRSRLERELKVEVGIFGGGESLLRAVTVSTYESAYLRAGEMGNRFNFIVFDEVHHLPAEGYRQIAEMFTAPHRMGLTATFEREDMLHKEIPRLVGGVVYELKPDDLAGKYLSEYSLRRISLELTDEEKVEYERNHKIFTDYLSSRGIRLTSPFEFQRFIMRSARDNEARGALLARNRAHEVAFNSETKMGALEEILRANPDDRVLIFTQHNQLVYRISRRFLIPYITHRSDKDERAEVLRRFKEGKYRAVVTSNVLDEGIDVPEASLGVIVSGTGSSREFTQRLGRLLRKSEGKQAKLIELVSKATSETRTSWRRTRSMK